MTPCRERRLNGSPDCLRSDSKRKLVSKQLLQQVVDEALKTVPAEPGESWQKGPH